MKRIEIARLLEELGNKSIENIKRKFVAKHDYMISSGENPQAALLLDALCTPEIAKMLSLKQFSLILEAVVTDRMKNMNALSRYCDVLISSAAARKGLEDQDSRAAKYAEYLQKTLVPRFKEKYAGQKAKKEGSSVV